MTYTSANIGAILSTEDISFLLNYDERLDLDSKMYEDFTLVECASYDYNNDTFTIIVECIELDEEFDDYDEAESYIDSYIEECRLESAAIEREYWASR